MTERRRSHWGWGFEDEQPSQAEWEAQAAAVKAHLGIGREELEQPVALERVQLPAPRVGLPAGLADICESDVHARALHALGRSYCDVVRGFRGRFDHPPDIVARPRDERQLEQVLAWCGDASLAAIPYGGGTSVVGGVEPRVPDRYNGAVSLDLGCLDRVVDVDEVSRAACIQAGASGPALEAQLARHGLTLRHFPQSFQFSTLGGWIATRAGGHFATVWTHMEDMVESVRAITPVGVWQSRRVPGSGAGVSPDRMLVGSEGILGVITEAWVRVQLRPSHRAQAAVRFPSFSLGSEAVLELSQAALHPANCRLIDPLEALTTGAGDGSCAVLVLGFESADHEVGAQMDRALQICGSHGGVWDGVSSGAGGAVSSWREAFLRAPYIRDLFVAMGLLSETFESAITWERFERFHERVLGAAGAAVEEVTGAPVCTGAEPVGLAKGKARISARFTHVYPDGPAPYYTVLAPVEAGKEVESWQAIKRAVSEVLIEEGATITHHHAVGRDHRPWYDRQRPEPFAMALQGAKRAVDPDGIMNPGVLVDLGGAQA